MAYLYAQPAPKEIVAAFFAEIRSGKNLGAVSEYLAPVVVAHQMCSENPLSLERSPQEYAGHVRDMVAACAGFEVIVDQLFAEGELVFARWTQRGVYAIADDDDTTVTAPITEFASAVYRVADGKIVEYWMQIDRLGTKLQVDRA